MKKQLESELISIAHKILKLTGREDLGKMQTEIALLYQKITILKFVEAHHGGQLPETANEDPSFFESLEPSPIIDEIKEDPDDAKLETDNTQVEFEEPTEEATDKILSKTEEAAEENAEAPFEETTEEASGNEESLTEGTNLNNEATEHDLNALSPSYAQLPIFDAIEEEASPQVSLNDQLKTQGFQIGLNDRLAFVKGLFENSNEDYDRVLSQLSTLDTYEEAVNMLDAIIKPDYNNWEGREEIEARFLERIENKFK